MNFWPPGTGRIYRQASTERKKGLPGPRAIAVASGKGGVGKTSLSVNLALCLAGMGKQVTLFDADLGLSNAEVLLGILSTYTLYDVLYGDKTMEEIVMKGPRGVKVISSGSGFLELANLDHCRRRRLLDMLDRYCGRQELVLIDTGAGINKNVLGFVAAAGEVIIVVTPEPTSMTDAYALIKVLANFKVHTDVGLVVNRAADRREAIHTYQRMEAAAGRFLEIKTNYLGWIPEDRFVTEAIKSQAPFLLTRPSSKPSRSVAGIAEHLVGTVRPVASEGFWSKLMGLFG